MVRESRWFEDVPVQSALSAASTAVIQLSLSAEELALRPFTVVRTRGVLFVRSDQQAATETYQAAVGDCVVSEQALAIGVTAVPTPMTDRGSDLWYLFEEVAGIFTFGSAVGFIEGGRTKYFDSRAMRKVEDGQDLIRVVETSSLSSGVFAYTAGRLLIKLH